MGDRNFQMKLSLKDICAVKHALLKQLKHKEDLLTFGHFTDQDFVSQLKKDIKHESVLVDIFIKAEISFKQKYSIQTNNINRPEPYGLGVTYRP